MSAAAFDALPRRAPPDPRQVQRCLLLAALLHVWLVLVFGNATGSAAPGQGVWGSLTVKLAGPSGGQARTAPDPSTPAAPPAPSRRADNGPAPAAPADTAAAQGRDRSQAPPQDPARSSDAPNTAPSPATLTLPDGFRPVEQEHVSPPPARPSAEVAPLPEPVTLNRLQGEPAPPAAPLASPTDLRVQAPARDVDVPPLPADLTAPLQRLDAATARPAARLPSPADLRLAAPPPRPVAPDATLPAPVGRLELPTGTTVPALPRAADLRPRPAPAVVAPTSADLPAAVRRLESDIATDRGATPALPRAADLRPAPGTSSATAQVTATDLPAPVRRLEAADAASSVTPLQPAANQASPSAAAAPSIQELSQALPGTVSAPAAVGPASGDPASSRFAAPSSGSNAADAAPRLPPQVPLPPSAAASTPQPPLNLSLPRGDMTSRRGPGLVELLPAPPERKSKLEQSIEDATNKDCRKAYANAGVLAAVPLAIDAVRGKGCKW